MTERQKVIASIAGQLFADWASKNTDHNGVLSIEASTRLGNAAIEVAKSLVIAAEAIPDPREREK